MLNDSIISIRNKIPGSSCIVLLSILVVAALLRTWGLHFGLPDYFHPDEEKYILMALKIGNSGANPHYFVNPPLFTYLLFVLYAGLFLILKLVGTIHSSTDFLAYYLDHPSGFMLIARSLSVFFGVLTVFYVHRILRIIVSAKWAIFGSLLAAVNFSLVRESHYAVPDATMTALLTISLYYLIRFVQEPKNQSLYLSAFFSGIAIATKYTAVWIVPVILLGIIITYRKTIPLLLKQVIISLLVCGLTFWVICPFMLIDTGAFMHDIRQLSFFSSYGWFGTDYSKSAFWFYLSSLSWGMGFQLLCLSVLAWGYSISRFRKTPVFLISIFILLYSLFLCRSALRFERFALPLIPAFILLAIAMLQEWEDKIHRHAKVIPAILVIIALLPNLFPSVLYGYVQSQKDTRTLAAEWIHSNLPKGSKIALDGYNAPIYTVHEKLNQFAAKPASQPEFECLYTGRYGLAIYPLSFYQAAHYDYLIISDYTYGKYQINSEMYQNEYQFYQALEEAGNLVQEFSPYKKNRYMLYCPSDITGPGENVYAINRPGPIIRIYTLK